jgi:predicted nucleic acid-binding protein
MLVLDASAVVELLLGGARAEPVLQQIEAHEGELHAPALLDSEVLHAFRGLVRSGGVSAARGAMAVELLGSLPLARHPATPLLPRMWELRHRLSGYDATYLALAEALEAPLLTFDAGLAAAAGPKVRLLVRP